MDRHEFALFFTLALIPAPAAAQQCDQHCGTERWAIKTLTDAHVGQVDSTPQTTTVTALRRLRVPASVPRLHGKVQLPPDDRIAPIELTTYAVDAVLIGWKAETDEDFHVVIAPAAHRTQTMIVEIPSPTCPELCHGGRAALFAALRQRIIDKLGQPTTTFHRLPHPLPVHVVGVGFFDFAHGQTGLAPNAIELHPVLDLQFR